MPMHIWRVPLLATLVLVASCGGDDEDASPTTTDAPPTSAVTSTTEAVDPFTVPDDPADITEEYVEAVINEHNRVIGDALRIQLEGGDPQEIVDRYNAIYVPATADILLTDALNRSEEELARFKRPPGNALVAVTLLAAVTKECIAAEVEQDTSELATDAPPPFSAVVVLRRATESPGDGALNRTLWKSEGLSGFEVESAARCDS